MLSLNARAYLVWQVFDHVHRCNHPVRFVRLTEEVEDLAAWPEFREAALNDPRFLVVGDAVDIATAGIHVSAPVEEIVGQTLDLVRVPMPDQTLVRLVRRLRPDLPPNANPVERALNAGAVFRPWTGHLARRHWLQGVRSVPLPIWLPLRVAEAAHEVLTQADGPVSAAGLAGALAERFDLSITEAYQQMGADKSLLFLPGGSIALFDSVADEVAAAIGVEYRYENDNRAEELIDGGGDSADLPHDLVRQVMAWCRLTRAPISTGEIMTTMVRLANDDARYVATFRTITAHLGIAPELVPVGDNRWYPTAMVPGEVWMPVELDLSRALSGQRSTLQIERPNAGQTSMRFVPTNRADKVSVKVTAAHMEAGALSDPQLSALLPDQPILQVYAWGGQNTVWYNAEHNAIYGLSTWMREKGLQPNDVVTVTLQDGYLTGSVRAGVRLPYVSPASTSTTRNKRRLTHRALLPAITEILDRAGGSLERDQLMALLNEEDAWISWTEVQPLFERLPILKYDRGRCFLVRQLSGRRLRGGDSGAVRAEILGLLSLVPEEFRSEPEVVPLARLVATQQRVSASDEALLLPAAQREKGAAWERLVAGHLRYALAHLLRRRDVTLLLPYLEDYFQHAAIGVMAAVDRFDRSRGLRLQHALGWSLFAAINRARLEYLLPVHLPAHFVEKFSPLLAQPDSRDDVVPEETEEADEPAGLAEFWASVTFISWEDVAEEYEEGGLSPDWPGPVPQCPASCAEQQEMVRTVREHVGMLDQRTADVIARRFGLFGYPEQTLEEIGQVYGLTRERIRQIEARTLERLGKSRTWRKLREYLT